MIDDLISRLRAERYLRNTRDAVSVYEQVNPDGPEAAEALILLRDALTEIMAEYRAYGAPAIDVMFQIASDALTPTKIEKAEQHDS